MANLALSGYNPALGWGGGSLALVLTVAGNWLWYQTFEGKR
jgi:hypothetical protein